MADRGGIKGMISRTQIILDYAKWTALSATRSGTPSAGDLGRGMLCAAHPGDCGVQDVQSDHRRLSHGSNGSRLLIDRGRAALAGLGDPNSGGAEPMNDSIVRGAEGERVPGRETFQGIRGDSPETRATI